MDEITYPTIVDIIVLFGWSGDPHLIAVAEQLATRGKHSYIFDPSREGDTIEVSYRGGAAPTATLRSSCFDPLDIHDVRSCWLRVKPFVAGAGWGPFQTSAAQFAQSEWRSAIPSLEFLFPHLKWINKPSAQQRLSKPLQLKLAIEAGFTVPETLISNHADALRSLCQPDLIYKSLTWMSFPDQTGILTTRIDEDVISSNRRSIARAPGIYQTRIEKRHELRITVVGKKCFGARINTPSDGLASVDWRHAHFENIFDIETIGAEVIDKIIRFQEQANLGYGAYDFIVDHRGETIFLECNPAGQYKWLEDSLDIPISASIAEHISAL